MLSPVNVTVRCADCESVLAIYYRVPPDHQARIASSSNDLLEWHRAETETCTAQHVTSRAYAERR
jgi:hypothetical protein